MLNGVDPLKTFILVIPISKGRELEAGEMTQSARCVPWKPEDCVKAE